MAKGEKTEGRASVLGGVLSGTVAAKSSGQHSVLPSKVAGAKSS